MGHVQYGGHGLLGNKNTSEYIQWQIFHICCFLIVLMQGNEKLYMTDCVEDKKLRGKNYLPKASNLLSQKLQPYNYKKLETSLLKRFKRMMNKTKQKFRNNLYLEIFTDGFDQLLFDQFSARKVSK